MDPAALNYVRRGARIGQSVGGIGGAAIGGLAGGLPKTTKDREGNSHTRTKGDRLSGAAIGALSGGYVGYGLGQLGGAVHHANKWIGGHRPAMPRPDWLKGAKTKAEAKSAFRTQARKTHPDHGGTDDAFRKIHSEWEKHEPTFKTAMLNAFADELQKIASVGAILGGVAGFKLGPNTARGKVTGTLVGAGLGHAVDRTGKALKRTFIDEPDAREERELYGHQPVAGYSY